MASGKKKMDLPKPAPARMDQLKEALSAEKTYQVPLTKPLLSIPTPANHVTIQQFKFSVYCNPPALGRVSAHVIITHPLSDI